ncbi:hypothetical protein J6590_054231, partial [Homalodisca vitripennis]
SVYTTAPDIVHVFLLGNLQGATRQESEENFKCKHRLIYISNKRSVLVEYRAANLTSNG